MNFEVTTPEANDIAVNALVILPRRNSYARGKVIRRKRDTDGNAVGRENDNPIIDTREYCVEFNDGEVSELTSNVISDSMDAVCDESRNEYLMMDSIVDYWKRDKSISVSSQKVVHRRRSFMQRFTVGWNLCIQYRDGSI